MGMYHSHGASPYTLAEAEHAYRVGLFDLAEKAYTSLVEESESPNPQWLVTLVDLALRQEKWSQAAALLERPELAALPDRAYWQAQLDLGRGNLEAAERLLQSYVDRTPEPALAREASLSLAVVLLDQARYRDAVNLLERWTRADDARFDFLKAKLALLSGNTDNAINRFERLRGNYQGLPPAWIGKIYLGLAMGRLNKRPSQTDSAIEVLRIYLEKHSASSFESDVMSLLDQAGAFDTPEQRKDWLTWAQDRPQNQRLAFALANAKAEATDGRFLAALAVVPDVSLPAVGVAPAIRQEVLVQRAKWLLASGNASGALSFIEGLAPNDITLALWRDELEFVRGIAHFREGQIAEAQTAFAKICEISESTDYLKAAAFNGVITQMASENTTGDTMPLRKTLSTVAEPAVEQFLGGEAIYQRARLLARDPATRIQADAALKSFLTEYPTHVRSREAQVARVELALSAEPPDLALARRLFVRLRRTDDGKLKSDRERYLQIWGALRAGNLDQVDRLASEFAREEPRSAFLGQVRARQAEAALANHDLPLVERALAQVSDSLQVGFLRAYLAQYEGRHRDAVEAWGRLIDETEGEPQLIARHQQALTLCQQNLQPAGTRFRAGAVGQWDHIIRLQPSPALLFRALCGKGECRTLQAQEDPQFGTEAISLFEQIATHPDASPEWREQAWYRIGMVYLALRSPGEALTAFDKTIEQFEQRVLQLSDDDPMPDLNWFYRSGFEAITLAETLGQYQDAAKRADTLASIPGPLAAEARERASKIRTERDLWGPMSPFLDQILTEQPASEAQIPKP